VHVDLNADVGEGFDDERLLDIVTSANVACGVHAGSAETMRAACAAAADRGVAVGAHPAYRDREGFGRRRLEVEPAALREEIAGQVGALAEIASAEGAAVGYVKPHGALYTRAIADGAVAEAVVDAVADRGLAVLCWPESELAERARAAGLLAVPEGFADRGYANGRLIPRGEPGALLEPSHAARQAVELARRGEVQSICVHGDTPGAAEVAAQVRAALEEAGHLVRAFA
jgi:UPF0271 protein